jgi:MFS family permease
MPTDMPDHSSSPDWVETVYERLAGDQDGRVCHAIPAQACREAPGNFLRLLVANTLSTLGDSLASAKTTLPWLLAQLGAPPGLAALLVPIRESGSMLPQLAIGALVRRRALRRPVWVAGALLQSACLAGMGWLALVAQGAAAGWGIVGLLALFSVARGACSIAYKDVLGKTIPKTRRGRLSGWIAAVAGAGAMAAGAALGALSQQAPGDVFAGILATAAACWALAAAVYARVVEWPGATEGGVDGLGEAFGRLSLLRDDAGFRWFVVARALALGSALAAPLVVALARDALGDALAWLGLFLALEGLASLVSAPLWGRWADRSSRRVFAAASALAGALSLAVAAAAWSGLAGAPATLFYPLAFMGLGIAHAGVRLGRKTYLVDVAEGTRRTDYVAVSNTVIGALLLLAGAAGALAASVSVPATVAALAVASLAGAALSLRWPAPGA